jgi:uncharacterized protein
MIELGKYNVLKVERFTSEGIYLTDDAGNEVLLPNSYVPPEINLQDQINVFIYTDSEPHMVATTLSPKIILNEFSLLKVMNMSRFGAFMDWGLPKELLVPFSEQPVRMKEGEWHLIYLYHDIKTDRLVGSAHIEKFLNNQSVHYYPGDEVDLIVIKETKLGFKVIIDNKFEGLLFKNEVFQSIKTGYRTRGYIKKCRDDNKIDVSLHRFGYRNIAPNAERILNYLKRYGGYLSLSDKSNPEEISTQLEMSKKTFKKAIGDLFKQRLIIIEPGGIRLINP